MRVVSRDQGERRSKSEKHLGQLSFLTEADEIRRELACSAEQAYEIQRQRAAERMREAELEAAESNVIQFRPRLH
ncbi:MAG: hypothetical protein ACXVBW_14005 [Bdellovibrionota bacterium]